MDAIQKAMAIEEAEKTKPAVTFTYKETDRNAPIDVEANEAREEKKRRNASKFKKA